MDAEATGVDRVMKAGREVDTLIETEVFGNEVVERMCLQSYDCGTWGDAEDWYDGNLKEDPGMSILPCVYDGVEYVPIPHYSTQIADAWLVVEKVNHDNAFELYWYNPDGRKPYFRVAFGFGIIKKAEADTAPLAICLAALEAVA